MTSHSAQQLKNLLYPYLFVLKEGQGIKRDFLDYSLCMLQVGAPEVIPSPKPFAETEQLLADLEKLKSALKKKL